MRFARLIDETSVDAASAALRDAELSGFERVWLSDSGAVDPRMVVAAVNANEMRVVLRLNPADDASVPPGLPLELAVSGGTGWQDSARALLAAAPYRPEPAVWVAAGDVGTVAVAARAGVGVALEPFERPEDAADWVAEYEAELAAASAEPIGETVNAEVAVFLPAGGDPGELVGLIERYREAGVDQVILTGDGAIDREFARAVIAEFDDDDVRADAADKAERLAPAIAAMAARRTAEGGAGVEAAGSSTEQKETRKVSKDATRRAAALQQSVVRKMSDRQLEFFVGNRAGVSALMRAMARMYRPSQSNDFSGPIEFTLRTRRGAEVWTLDCSATGATAHRGPSAGAKLRLEAGIADFLRVGVGEIAAPSAVLGGKLEVTGDFGLALRMGEMFGGPSVV